MTRIVTALGVLLLILALVFFIAHVGNDTVTYLMIIVGALALGVGQLTGR